MGLFSKKEKVPEIPPSPTLPDLPSPPTQNIHTERNLPELPSFPANSQNEDMNQQMVKHAVTDNTPEDNEVVVEPPTALSQGGVHNNSKPPISTLPKLPSMPVPPVQEEHKKLQKW